MKILETKLKLFTAKIELTFYYANCGKELSINIAAKNIEEALEVAKLYVSENHCILKLVNNEEEPIYMLKELK